MIRGHFLLTFLVAAIVVSCSGMKGKKGAAGGQPPVEAVDAAASADAVQEAAATGEAAQPAPKFQPPPISECLDWTPKKLLEETGNILKDVKDKPVADLKSVKCFEKGKPKKKQSTGECQEHECLAWIEYWSSEGKSLYKQLDMDGALADFLKAAKLARQCQIGGATASSLYVNLGMVLIDGYGEIMKGSLAFRWAMLYKWDVSLPESPAPNVQKTFDVVKQSMGAEPISCAVQ
jgi:hypothetical protein